MVDVRRVVPAADLRIEGVTDAPAGLVCRRGHPLLQNTPASVSFDALLTYPVASTPLSAVVARMLVARYGPRADPAQLITLQCEEIASLIDTVRQTDAVYLGILGAVRGWLDNGELVQLPMLPSLDVGARFALITLAGRTELPVMAEFRRFVTQRFKQLQIPKPQDHD